MVSMPSRNPETESTDPDIRMAYQSVTLQGTLNWSVLAPPPQVISTSSLPQK